MLYARMSVWKFKTDQKEKGLAKLDEYLSDRSTQGFRGYIKLFSNDETELTLITLWENESAIETSGKQLFKMGEEGSTSFTSKTQDIEPYVVYPPNVRHLKLNAELRI